MLPRCTEYSVSVRKTNYFTFLSTGFAVYAMNSTKQQSLIWKNSDFLILKQVLHIISIEP